MKHTLLALLLGMSAHSSFASQWFVINRDFGDKAVFFDKASASKDGATVSIWVKHVAYRKPIAQNAWSYAQNLKLNCTARSMQSLSSVFYDKEGAVLHASDQPKAATAIPPDSIGDVLHQIVCGTNFPRTHNSALAIGIPGNDLNAFTKDFAAWQDEEKQKAQKQGSSRAN